MQLVEMREDNRVLNVIEDSPVYVNRNRLYVEIQVFPSKRIVQNNMAAIKLEKSVCGFWIWDDNILPGSILSVYSSVDSAFYFVVEIARNEENIVRLLGPTQDWHRAVKQAKTIIFQKTVDVIRLLQIPYDDTLRAYWAQIFSKKGKKYVAGARIVADEYGYFISKRDFKPGDILCASVPRGLSAHGPKYFIFMKEKNSEVVFLGPFNALDEAVSITR